VPFCRFSLAGFSCGVTVCSVTAYALKSIAGLRISCVALGSRTWFSPESNAKYFALIGVVVAGGLGVGPCLSSCLKFLLAVDAQLLSGFCSIHLTE
jgi:hypothetical protein